MENIYPTMRLQRRPMNILYKLIHANVNKSLINENDLDAEGLISTSAEIVEMYKAYRPTISAHTGLIQKYNTLMGL
jgi:hypothetical protein